MAQAAAASSAPVGHSPPLDCIASELVRFLRTCAQPSNPFVLVQPVALEGATAIVHAAIRAMVRRAAAGWDSQLCADMASRSETGFRFGPQDALPPKSNHSIEPRWPRRLTLNVMVVAETLARQSAELGWQARWEAKWTREHALQWMIDALAALPDGGASPAVRAELLSEANLLSLTFQVDALLPHISSSLVTQAASRPTIGAQEMYRAYAHIELAKFVCSRMPHAEGWPTRARLVSVAGPEQPISAEADPPSFASAVALDYAGPLAAIRALDSSSWYHDLAEVRAFAARRVSGAEKESALDTLLRQHHIRPVQFFGRLLHVAPQPPLAVFPAGSRHRLGVVLFELTDSQRAWPLLLVYNEMCTTIEKGAVVSALDGHTVAKIVDSGEGGGVHQARCDRTTWTVSTADGVTVNNNPQPQTADVLPALSESEQQLMHLHRSLLEARVAEVESRIDSQHIAAAFPRWQGSVSEVPRSPYEGAIVGCPGLNASVATSATESAQQVRDQGERELALLQQDFARKHVESAVAVAVHLTKFSRLGPSLFSANHPRASVVAFTAGALDAAMESASLTPFPAVLSALIADYHSFDLPWRADCAQKQMAAFPLVEPTLACYAGHTENPVERLQRVSTRDALLWDEDRVTHMRDLPALFREEAAGEAAPAPEPKAMAAVSGFGFASPAAAGGWGGGGGFAFGSAAPAATSFSFRN